MTENLLFPLDALRRRHGAIREVMLETTLADLAVGPVQVVKGQVDLSLSVEVRGSEIAVSGSVSAEWTAECRRCLEPVSGHLDLHVSEVYVPDRPDGEGIQPDTGDVYLLDDENLDLEPLVRDAVLLMLPLSPLCRDECLGPDSERFSTLLEVPDDPESDRPMDPRWAVLDALRPDSGDDEATWRPGDSG